MIGVALPVPGILTFHLTLLVSLQVVGGSAEGATPVWSGPRHCGQFWFGAVVGAAWVTQAKARLRSATGQLLRSTRRFTTILARRPLSLEGFGQARTSLLLDWA